MPVFDVALPLLAAALKYTVAVELAVYVQVMVEDSPEASKDAGVGPPEFDTAAVDVLLYTDAPSGWNEAVVPLKVVDVLFV